ncbi:S-layer homology domain-containing protein [Desulforamulus putei]|uniref:S-layer homology domain-containing protein n=1 Tax=Desulforamulus putei DSM 12395 TaxID=1121429 RepID=A0A1M5ATW1_9FIRM|nr:S-layer homology domain-containing protein [Desulforamulus putei]SHF33673.1 S-layer homology domain-containing protein [Desulforamulus putei DSM 12395]
MNKLRTAMITLTLVGTLLVGGAVADAAPGHGKGSSDKGSKPSSSHVQKGGNHVTGQQIKENKMQAKPANKANRAVKFQAKNEVRAFTDTNKHWAQVPIQRLQLLGVVSGFPDGCFHPEEPVTQEQVIAMVMGALDTQEETTVKEIAVETGTKEQTEGQTTTGESGTRDKLSGVPDWAKGSVEKARAKGIINLNRFHSGVQASRVQAMVWVAKAMGLQPVDTSNLPFKDGLLVSPEDIGYVMALYNEGIIKGGPGGLLNPNSSITRAQIAALIDRVLTQQQQNQDANTFQAVETVDGNQVLKIGTGDNATEVELAEDAVIFINGQRAEASALVPGSPVRVVTNEEGEAVLVEQTVETTQPETGSTNTDVNPTTEESANSDTTTSNEANTDTAGNNTTTDTGSAS